MNTRSEDDPRVSGRVVGILLFLLAQFFASWQAGFSKLAVSDLPVMMVVWGRFAGVLTVALVMALVTVTRAQLMPNRPWLYVLRGALLAVASISFVVTTKHVPLADAIAVAFVYPFIVTALAPWILREKVGLITWVAVMAGFIGVLVVVRPGMHGFEPLIFGALVAGIAFAVVLVLTGLLALRAPPVVTVLWTAVTSVAITSLALPFMWVTPTLYQAGVLVLVGAFAAGGNILQLYAAQKCDVSVLAPFGYSEIITMTVIGVILFGDWPDYVTFIGMAIIMVSGLVVAFTTVRKS